MDLSVTDAANPVRTPAPPLEAVRIHYVDQPAALPALTGARPKRDWLPPLILAIITLIGGCFRFYRLTYPALWNDETLVYWRVCGTYGQMLKPLQDADAFPPLHYSLYWLIGRFHRLTPLTMRMVPAICGTLNIPAIYFLSRQLLSKKTSLLAAAFTACSAFMLFYSRDAKMYPDAWLLATLNIACLWQWFRTRSLTMWLCWVAAGCGMVGIHLSTLVLPPLSLLFLLTQRRMHWAQVLWFLAGLAMIVAGPIGYYTKFNTVIARVEENGWQETGTGWVNWYNGDRTGPEHALFATTAFLIGYEWPRDDYVAPKAPEPISPPLIEVPETAAMEVMWILAIAALPWPMVLRPRSRLDQSPEPQWRIVLWLGSWILLVGYAFYCHSVENFVSPRRWDYELRQWLPLWAVAALLGIVAAFVFIALIHAKHRESLIRFGQLLLVIAALYAGCYAVFLGYFWISSQAMIAGKPLQSLWEPRYLGFIWPAVAIAVAALLMRLPTRAVRIACIIFVLSVNLGMGSLRMVITTEPPIDLLARDIAASQDPKSTVRAFDLIGHADIGVGGTGIHPHPKMATGRYYLEMQTDPHATSPDLFVDSYNRWKLRSNFDLNWFKRNITSSPQLNDVILWMQLMPLGPDGRRADEVAFDPHAKALGSEWKMTSEQEYTIRIYWDWRERWKWVRREYVKK